MQYKSDESFFNMAIAYLERINKILYRCQEAAMTQNIDEWRNCLRALYRELSIKLKKIERDEVETKFTEINNIANIPGLKITQRQKILFLLDQLDIHLRSKLQEKAMLLPSKSDPRYAILNR